MNFKIFLVFILLSSIANAQTELNILSTDIPDYVSHLKDPALTSIFTQIPNIVQSNTVKLSGSNLAKAALIEQWKLKHNRPNPDAYYYKNNIDLYNSMDTTFKNIFFNLLSSQEIKNELTNRDVKFDGKELFVPNNYIIKEYSPSADGILILSVLNVCVKNGINARVVKYKKHGPLAELDCNGGTTQHIIKIHRLFYNPLCGDAYCKTSVRTGAAFTVRQVYPATRTNSTPHYKVKAIR